MVGDAGDDYLDGGRNNDTLYGGDGNDQIVGGAGSDFLYGDAGNDVLLAGVSKTGGDTGAINVVYGGIGDDEIYGDIGADTIYGEAGNDRIDALAGNDAIYAGDGSDTVIAGAGSDLVVGGWGKDTIYADRDSSGNTANAGDVNTIYGDLDGTARDSTSVPGNAQDHQDLIYGDVGDDFIYAGYGDDTVYGLQGNDWIEGGWQADLIYAGVNEAGSVSATPSRNTIYGDTSLAIAAQSPPGLLEAHRDRIYGDVGDDMVYAGEGADAVYTLAGNDTVYAGNGDDVVDTSIGDDTVFGEAGDDVLLLGVVTLTAGQSDKDLAYGGSGKDTIRGFADDDFIVGGTGDDDISSGTGSDVIWGGSDAISFSVFNRGDLNYPTNFPGAEWPAIVTQTQTRIVPTALAGLSVEGQIEDGSDTIRGDDGNDWIFGGGAEDSLFGGTGIDYVDGGAGNDRVDGGDGDDVLRGGTNDDVILGGIGIDQLFGDDGSDRLFADGGSGTGVSQSLSSQRLFGGEGIDYLYGFSFSIAANDVAVESQLVGEEFHGGGGGDWIYGSIRRDTFYGDAGNDTIQGDALVGPNYAESSTRSTIGGDDMFYGGTGEDRLYGGGGIDTLWGGADSDWLEGQDGVDTLYGGSGIDMMLLDTSTSYATLPAGQFEVFDGHYGNAIAGDVADDNATDILLIEGTDSADTISIGQVNYTLSGSARTGTRLSVGYSNRNIQASWRDFTDPSDTNGKPRVEQIRVSGLGGADTIGFLATTTAGIDPLDVTDLTARSDDWVGVLDGGPGNDVLSGSNARDRIDGGSDSDVIYGFAGDDQLWGDGGPGLGNSGDNDTIFGGQGNDDVLGGQGTNTLYAWSRDPKAGGQFGIFVDDRGNLFDNDGDLNVNGILDLDENLTGNKRGPYSLEDTGLNRMLGGSRTDLLYGGTGLDFMYGNGSDSSTNPDVLYDRSGKTFDTRGVLAGDEWKVYAKSTDKVWYYGGTNRDDVINVDYVTEPGVLQGHHLITRLTNNNGNYTFDAQVQLDFTKWSSDDSFYGLALTGGANVPGTVPFSQNNGRTNGILANDAQLAISVDGAVAESIVVSAASTNGTDGAPVNSSIRDLAADITRALPASLVGKVVARANGDRISLIRTSSATVSAASTSIVVSFANAAARNELGMAVDQSATIGFVGSNGLKSLLPPEGDFSAIIIDALDGNDTVTVGPTVIKSVWTDGGKGDDTIKYISGKPILADLGDTQAGNTLRNDTPTAAYPLGAISSSQLFSGLTIDNPIDSDWYTFTLATTGTPSDFLRVPSISPNDRLSFGIYNLNGAAIAGKQYANTAGSDPLIALSGLVSGEYKINVTTDRIPTVYELDLQVGTTSGNTATSAKIIPAIETYGSIVGLPLKANGAVDSSTYYEFALNSAGVAGDQLSLSAFAVSAPVTMSLIRKSDDVVIAQDTTGSVDLPSVVSLTGLAIGVYQLKVTSNGSGRYELIPRIAYIPSGASTTTYGTKSLDYSTEQTKFLGVPLVDPLSPYKYTLGLSNTTGTGRRDGNVLSQT